MKRKEITELGKEQVDLANAIDNLFGTKGWQIYKSFLSKKIQKIRLKDTYRSLQDFRADRKAIKILLNLDAELQDAVRDGREAQEIIKQLNQTSEDIPLDDEETE